MLAPMFWIALLVAILITLGKEGRRKLNKWAFRLVMLVGLIDVARMLTIGAGQPVGIFIAACAITAGAWFAMERFSVSTRRIERRETEKRRAFGYVTAAPE